MSRAGISEAGICVLGTRGIFQGCGGYNWASIWVVRDGVLGTRVGIAGYIAGISVSRAAIQGSGWVYRAMVGISWSRSDVSRAGARGWSWCMMGKGRYIKSQVGYDMNYDGYYHMDWEGYLFKGARIDIYYGP